MPDGSSLFADVFWRNAKESASRFANCDECGLRNPQNAGKSGHFNWHGYCNGGGQKNNGNMEAMMKRQITIDGDLDAERVEKMRKTLDELANDNSDLAIDMSKCTFLDSSGVGAIVYVYKRKLARGYSVRLQGLAGQPQKLLRHLGIASLLADADRNAA